MLYVNKAREDGSVDMTTWQEVERENPFDAIEWYLWDVIHTYPDKVYVATKNPTIKRGPFMVTGYRIEYPQGKTKSPFITTFPQ